MGNNKSTKRGTPPKFDPRVSRGGSRTHRFSQDGGIVVSDGPRRRSSGTRKIGEALLKTPPPTRGRSRQMSSAGNSNRYEGLGDASKLSRTLMRESRQRGESFSSMSGKIALVAGKHQIEFDNINPPPPPPSDDDDLALLSLPPPPVPEDHQLSDEDTAFVDYTVVPLLLRSEMDYNEANKFGEYLKKRYKGSHIRFIMSDVGELMTAIEASGVKVSDDFRFKIVADEYWEVHKNDDPESRTRRTSFVYYREETPSLRMRSRPQSSRSQRRSNRRSMRKEFEQEKVVTKNDAEFDIGLWAQMGLEDPSSGRVNDLTL